MEPRSPAATPPSDRSEAPGTRRAQHTLGPCPRARESPAQVASVPMSPLQLCVSGAQLHPLRCSSFSLGSDWLKARSCDDRLMETTSATPAAPRHLKNYRLSAPNDAGAGLNAFDLITLGAIALGSRRRFFPRTLRPYVCAHEVTYASSIFKHPSKVLTLTDGGLCRCAPWFRPHFGNNWRLDIY